ncbi:MAG: hypothetical protein ACRDIZ_12780 [Actinomycetota bacterium]
MAEAPACVVCGRPTYDPDKRERPWARGVRGGRQVLVCPRCQADRPDWQASMDTCPSCGSTRLTVTLGEVTCRACGHISPAA